MDVEFEEVTFRARENLWNFRETKCILNAVSGRFEAGHLSAILGPSGAGKSSLLNSISGFRLLMILIRIEDCNEIIKLEEEISLPTINSSIVEDRNPTFMNAVFFDENEKYPMLHGEEQSRGVQAKSFKVNGQPRDEKLFRKLSCYITQEEVLQPLLSLQEVMMFAADLKLPSGATRKQKAQLVHEILTMLGLTECCLTRTELLSGGQKKRLSIALELINNPPVIFLDEPTSGLDNVSTLYTLKLLRRLAHQGRTIVCTIHQPSASLFQLFDHVYVLSKGKCVYQGSTGQLVPFLSSAGFDCPTHYNPADFIIELTDADHEQNIDVLAEATGNGKLCLYKSGPSKIPMMQNNNMLPLNNNTEFDEIDPLISYRDQNDMFKSAFVDRMKFDEKNSGSDLCADFPISGFSQFCVLWRRMMLQIYRNKVALNIQFYHHLLCSVAVGIIYYDKAKEGEEFFNHLKFCLGIVLFHTFTYCMIPVITYPYEVKLLRREYFNRWYSLRPYFIAIQLSKIPTMFVFSMIFLSIIYFSTGLPIELDRFLLFSLIALIVSVTAEGMGLFIGSVFSVTNGSAVAPLTLAPFLGLATYGFDFAKEIPWYVAILMKMSFLRSGTVAVVLTVFGFGRKKLSCSHLYCHFADPKVLLQYVDVDHVSVWEPITYLVIIMIAFRVGMYVALRVKVTM